MSKFKISISSTILENFGEHLYDSVPPVLSEIVANAWDADATEVNITVNKIDKKIIIEDNGCGMTAEDINGKFLNIGFRKRDKSQNGDMRSRKYNRLYMGRKGVGKLAIFAIADSFTLETVSDVDLSQKNAFVCSKKELMKNVDVTNYEVPEVNCTRSSHGTTITITNVADEKRYDTNSIKLMILQRFPNLNDKFTIKINGEEIVWEENERLFKKFQYVFLFGNSNNIEKWEKIFKNIHPAVRIESLVSCGNNDIYGWIASTGKPSDLKVSNEWSWNVISVIVREKLAQEDILKYCDQNMHPSRYMTGMVFADYLDKDNEDDIATTNRQSIKESKRYDELLKNMRNVVKECSKKWLEYRQESETQTLLKINSIAAWYKKEQQETEVPELRQQYLKHLASTINSFKVSKYTSDIEHQADEIGMLCEGALLSYEHAKRSNTVKELVESIGRESNEFQQGTFKSYVGKYGAYISEAFYPIVKERLEIINKLQHCINRNVVEKELQLLLHKNLWLIRPVWENIQYTLDTIYKNKLEEHIKTEIGGVDVTGRIDISVGKIDGSYIIIELKRYEVTTKMNALDDQIIKYRKFIAQRANLENYNKQDSTPSEYKEVKESDVVTYIILGQKPSDWSEKESLRRGWKDTGVYVLFYDELLRDAKNQYLRYITENSKSNEVIDNIKKIRKEVKEQLLVNNG